MLSLVGNDTGDWRHPGTGINKNIYANISTYMCMCIL